MSYSSFSSPNQGPIPWVYRLWIPLLAPLVFFLVDNYLIPAAFTLPLMLFVLVSYLAFRLPPALVAFWSAFYAIALFTLLKVHIQLAYTAPYMMPYMRTIGFIVAGTVATLLASHRVRLEKSSQALFSVILAFPTAVIISDISGNILLLNTAAEKILQGRINQLSGLSYFSTFIDPEEQGQAIAKYVSYFDHHHSGTVPLALHLRQEPPLILQATLTVVRLDKNQYAVTVIEKVEEEAGAPSRHATV